MRSMTRTAVAGCIALAALSAVTVLDVGSTTAEAAPSVSPFAGMYLSDVGPRTVAVSDGGQISGGYDDGSLEMSIAGKVSAGGSYSFTVTTSTYNPVSPRRIRLSRSTTKSSGTMALDADGNIVGTPSTGASFVWIRQ